MKSENFPPPPEADDEVTALIATLHATERRLEELTGGEVDTVSSGSGQPFLLRRAQTEMRHSEASKQAAILNALPAHIALLDARGAIVSVNETWRRFATANGLPGSACGIGLNYLDVCDRAQGGEVSDAHRAAAGIRTVLAGAKSFSIEYPCHSPTELRWFQLTATPLSAAPAHGVVVMHLNITERKRAETAMRESNEKFHQLADNITDAFWIRSPDMSEVHYVSPAFETIWGRSVASLHANPHQWVDFIFAEDRERVQRAFAALTGGAASLDIEYRITRPDGEIRWVRVRGFQIRNAADRLIRHIGIVSDITDRKRSVDALQESERQLAHAMSMAQLVAWEYDVATGQFHFSDRYYLLHGTTAEREGGHLMYAGDFARKFVHPDDAHLVAEEVRKAVATVDPNYQTQLNCRVLRRDGELRHVLVTLSVRMDASGRTVQIRGANQDITERTRIEEALRASERRFKALFEQAAVGVAQAEAATGRFVQVNQRFADILGRSREELEQLTFVAITHPQDVAFDVEKMRQLRAGDIREYGREKRYRRSDGSDVWVSLTVSAMWAPGETPSLCIAVVQDITERKRLDEHLLQAQKMEALGQFSGGVAHDFNNILATICGYTELSLATLQDNPEVRGHLEAVFKAARRATDLVKQILTFSRQEPLERDAIQLRPVVEDCIKLLRATLPSTIAFATHLAADAPGVLANANQVHQVLTNLGVNAWHAMQDRPGCLQIDLVKWTVDEAQAAVQPRLRPGAYVRVSVSDTGCGMDPATLRRIFEPFFTTKPVGQGTGLGLSVVHGIMDAHDGAVTVYSHPGEGTVFHLYFPAHAGETSVGAIAESPMLRGNGEAVLVVDDEEMIATMIQRTLTRLDYLAESTTDPAAALALVRAAPERFKLVLSDQTMPGTTGLALATLLRETQPDLPVILMTGFSASLTPERLEKAGVREVLFKPLSVRLLSSAAHAALHAKPRALS